MSPHTKIDTLILSDTHLGSPVGKARQIASLLKQHKFKRLILLGDIIDNSAFDHLDKDHLSFMEMIRKLAAPESGCEVIWISGNHDRKMRGSVKKLIGIPVHEHYAWEHNHKKFLAVHGDQFDGFIESNSRTNAMAHSFFLYLQRLDPKGQHLIKYVDRSNAFLRRLSKKVSTGAIAYAKTQDAEIVFCGHTHVPMEKIHNDGDSHIHYVNVGCWTHTPSTFAAIDDKGNVMLEKYV